jgi:STE24 endopeptidase
MKILATVGLIMLAVVMTAVPLFADSTAVTNPPSDTLTSSAQMTYPLSPERQEQLVSYSRFNNIWLFVEFLAGLAVLALILFTGLSARFRDWTSSIKLRFFAVWAFAALVIIAEYVLYFPFDVFRSFFVERSYGFLNQGFAGWFGESLLGLFLGVVISIIPIWFFYWLIKNTKRWWLVFSVGAVPFLVFFIVVAPVVISPMFNDFTPLKDKALESEIRTLAQKGGIGDADIFEVNGSKQSSKVNAYVTGLMNTRRIVLYDTMIKGFTPEEIKFVMGHEMGHYVMNHIWWGVLVATLSILIGTWLMDKTIHPVIRRFKNRFGFDQLSDIASLPLVMAYISVFFFLFQPVTNGLSRYMETQADRYGMEMSGVSVEDAARAFDKLSVYNLSDPNPNPILEFWFYSHPAIQKRIEAVRGMGR